MQIKTATIVGVGLIGGSLAAAWRETDFASHIVGVEYDSSAAQVALQRGLVDEISASVPIESELIAVCVPSDQIAAQVAELNMHPGAVFDVGSVKGPIMQTLLDQFGTLPAHFVPCHPIAGSEQSGPQAARADLFSGATIVVSATVATDPKALQLVHAAWRASGARVVELSAAEHDEMLAVTSHLPHLLAFAFMQQVEPKYLPYAGGGFRDFTRIAAANPELWWRILSMNKTQVLMAVRQFGANLEALSASLEDDDAEAGIKALTHAARLRQSHNK